MKNLIIKNYLNLKISLKYGKYFRETHKLKNSKNDYSVFLLGTGISVNLIDYKKILTIKKNNFEIFSVGGYFESDLSNNLIPDYYLLSDKRTIIPEKTDISDNEKKNYRETLNKLCKLRVKTFIPVNYINDRVSKELNVLYFNNFFSSATDNFSDITKTYNYNSISGIKALSACIYMGYKNIYLCGFDNNHWNNIKVDKENRILQINRHFYDDDKKYHLNKTGKSISDMLLYFHEIFKSYELFRSNRIINLDPNGLIDVFSKKHELDIYKK